MAQDSTSHSTIGRHEQYLTPSHCRAHSAVQYILNTCHTVEYNTKLMLYNTKDIPHSTVQYNIEWMTHRAVQYILNTCHTVQYNNKLMLYNTKDMHATQCSTYNIESMTQRAVQY